jgi:hypothetical protein
MSGLNNPSPPIDPDALARALARALGEVFSWRGAACAALLGLAEAAMWSLVEDAPGAVKFATLVAPLLAFLTIQFEARLRQIHVDLYPGILVGLTVLYLGFGAW